MSILMATVHLDPYSRPAAVLEQWPFDQRPDYLGQSSGSLCSRGTLLSCRVRGGALHVSERPERRRERARLDALRIHNDVRRLVFLLGLLSTLVDESAP